MEEILLEEHIIKQDSIITFHSCDTHVKQSIQYTTDKHQQTQTTDDIENENNQVIQTPVHSVNILKKLIVKQESEPEIKQKTTEIDLKKTPRNVDRQKTRIFACMLACGAQKTRVFACVFA